MGNISHMGFLSLSPAFTASCATTTNPVNHSMVPTFLPEGNPSQSSCKSIAAKVPAKYHEFLDIFVDKEATELPPHCAHDIKIELEYGKSPPFGPIYMLTNKEKVVLQAYLSENLAKGFIQLSTSSAASPILFVKKGNGSLWLCVDYRGLNAIPRRNRYHLPLVNDLLEAVQGCKSFSKINLKSAFNLLRVASGDEW